MRKQQLRHLLISLFTIFITVGCGSVKRIKTSQVKDISGRWNDTDAGLVAEEMIKDIVTKGWLPNFKAIYERQPIVVVGDIGNKTHEHIDAEPFIKDIERDLINTQTVRIITNGTFREKVRSEREDQKQNIPGAEAQKKIGRELGADFMLFGHINTIVDTSPRGKQRVIFYQVTLELADLATQEIVWIGDKKIKKFVKR